MKMGVQELRLENPCKVLTSIELALFLDYALFDEFGCPIVENPECGIGLQSCDGGYVDGCRLGDICMSENVTCPVVCGL